MTKVLKHKNGWQAEQKEDGVYKLRNPNGFIIGTVYSDLVEGEGITDWEEVTKEPYVFTEDAGEIYDKDQRVFKATPSLKVLQIESYYADENMGCIKEDTKFFKIREHAEDYIQRKELRYSNDDLEALKHHIIEKHVLDGSLEYRQGVIDAYNKAERLIHELKASKND